MSTTTSAMPIERIRQGFWKWLHRLRSVEPVSILAKQIRLRDGRQLGYAEFGDAKGKPVFFFHGLPGSRLFRPPDNSIAASLGVRLITVDRPGFGLSDFKPGRQLLDWPEDVLELADSLGFRRFAVAGVSAGGPSAAACAYKIPDRLTAAALISSAAPLQAMGITRNMEPAMRLNFRAARYLPHWSLLPMASLSAWMGRHHPEIVWQRTASGAPECDKIFLNQPEVKKIYLASIRETYRQGGRGPIAEAALVAGDWGFSLENIGTKTYVWHGTEDVYTPLDMGEHLAQAIPGCQATYLAQQGHLFMFGAEYWRNILTALVLA
jgi:pimeloyl-ACP methyl ester carboxylesterase